MLSSSRALGVLASGRGANFEALALAARRGEIPGHVAVLLCDRPGAPVIERARRLGIECVCPDPGPRRTRLGDERTWVEELVRRGVEVVLLAGFMRRLHADFLNAFPDRILNLHPSLLPSFPGLDAIARAYNHGVRVTGCTVHLVADDVDGGPIVAQRAVEVRDADTLESLEERLHEAEHALYPAAVRRYLTEPWIRAGRRLVFGAERANHV